MKMSVFMDPNFSETLTELMQVDVSPKAAYRLAKAHKVIMEEYARFEDLRKKILEKYAQKNEDGSVKVDEQNNILIEQEKVAQVTEEFTELFSIEFTIPDKVNIDELGDNVKIPAKLLINLSDMFH